MLQLTTWVIFLFQQFPMGTYTLYVSVPGYEAITIQGVQVVSGRTSYQNLVFDALPFTVYNINDNGPYYLRHMILDAKDGRGKDIINFIIPGTGPFTIQPLSALPIISDSVVIDATTQPGYSGSPLIEINGALAGSNVDGLRITGGKSTVQGLVINGFSGDEIRLLVAGQNTISGNFIGTNINGTNAVPKYKVEVRVF